MNEASKFRTRHENAGTFSRYFAPPRSVLDVGCGADKITLDARGWDLADGDAQLLEGIEDTSYDTVFSAHCLEHLRDPLESLLNWWRVVKPGGYLIILVPDEDCYEQHCWPSAFNPDHKWTFSISKAKSWSPVHLDLARLLSYLPDRDILSLQLVGPQVALDSEAPFDSTLSESEACIEAIIRKVPEPGERFSPFAPLFLCPHCKRLECTLLGSTPDAPSLLHCRCRSCGSNIQLNLKELLPST